MRFFHLSDLHIGKQLHNYNLREDQEHILKEIIKYAEELRPDAVVIAGDVYDKSVPSGEAVTVFDEFLTKLSRIEPKIPVLVIAGNHDSAQRLDYASRILGCQQIYIAGNAPETESDVIKRVTLEDAYGLVHFYLLPFLKPGYVRGVFDGELPKSYEEAVQRLLEREAAEGRLDDTQRNVLVSHQFYAGSGETPQTCDSEVFSVGGIDRIDSALLRRFDYAALGHLHGAQAVGGEQIRYCGSPLKYSVSEAGQEKALHVVSLGEKGAPVQIETYPLHPLRDVRKVRGTLAELLESAKASEREDYISITLTDEIDPYRPKEQLERVYTHILEVRTDNERTRRMLSEFTEEPVQLDPLTVFGEFYKEIQGKELPEEERTVLEQIIESAE